MQGIAHPTLLISMSPETQRSSHLNQANGRHVTSTCSEPVVARSSRITSLSTCDQRMLPTLCSSTLNPRKPNKQTKQNHDQGLCNHLFSLASSLLYVGDDLFCFSPLSSPSAQSVYVGMLDLICFLLEPRAC